MDTQKSSNSYCLKQELKSIAKRFSLSSILITFQFIPFLYFNWKTFDVIDYPN